MPLPSRPYKITCAKCHWTRRVVPVSDVILPIDMPNECPQCGSSEIIRTQLGIIDKALVSLMKLKNSAV